MNKVEVIYQDKKDRSANILLNGKKVSIFGVQKGIGKSIATKLIWQVKLSTIHNQSNPILFESSNFSKLIEKISKYTFELVRF